MYPSHQHGSSEETPYLTNSSMWATVPPIIVEINYPTCISFPILSEEKGNHYPTFLHTCFNIIYSYLLDAHQLKYQRKHSLDIGLCFTRSEIIYECCILRLWIMLKKKKKKKKMKLRPFNSDLTFQWNSNKKNSTDNNVQLTEQNFFKNQWRSM